MSSTVSITVTAPMCITPRLLPGIRVGADSWISLAPESGGDGAIAWRYYIDGPDVAFTAADISGPMYVASPVRHTLSALLSFLTADVERYQAELRNRVYVGPDPLFPMSVREWANGYSDELQVLACELDEAWLA